MDELKKYGDNIVINDYEKNVLIKCNIDVSKCKTMQEVLLLIDRYLDDADILDEEYSETNWSQGKMPLPVLERLLMPFLTSGNILGIDICGECQQGIPLPQYLEAEKINGETNKELFDFLMHYCRNF